MIKKADIVLLIVLVALGLAFSWWSIAGRNAGDTVVISVDGAEYGVYPLSEDKEIDIDCDGHHNHITIKSATVQMTSSNCKNQVCVDTGVISHNRESIVCLPNRVVVEIRSGNGGGVDVISG